MNATTAIKHQYILKDACAELKKHGYSTGPDPVYAIDFNCKVICLSFPHTMGNSGVNPVYTLRSSLQQWQFESLLVPPLGRPLDFFGHALAISRDGVTLCVSAPYSAWLSGYTGCVYVFQRTTDMWIHVETLVNPAKTDKGAFGHAVSLDTDGITLSVGDPQYTTSDGSNGRAYVFRRTQTACLFEKETILEPPKNISHFRFGTHVALSAFGQSLVVESYRDSPITQEKITTQSINNPKQLHRFLCTLYDAWSYHTTSELVK